MKMCLLAILICLLQSCLTNVAAGQETDSFGGFLNLAGTPGKYFHLEEIKGRHMLVTPEGHGFFSLGINHIGDILGKRPNDIVTELFDGDQEAYIADALKNLEKWNYNTVGYHNPWPIRRKMVSMADCYLVQCANYHPDNQFAYYDVWHPDFKKSVRKKIQQMADNCKGNNKVVGYYWSDTPQWDIKRARQKRGTDWVSTIRQQKHDAHGKKRYIEFLQERYTLEHGKGAGEKVKLRYSLTTADWSKMISEPFDGIDLEDEHILADDYAFLGIIAAEFYKDMGEATKNADPGRLIFGERFLVGDHPDVVLEQAVKWIDVISYQPGGNRFNAKKLDEIWAKYKKPIMLCDHSISFATEAWPNTMWNKAENGQAAGRLITLYKLDAIKKPYIIGYHRCQYISRSARSGNNAAGSQLKQGVLQTNAKPYVSFAAELTAGNEKVLKAFANSVDPGK